MQEIYRLKVRPKAEKENIVQGVPDDFICPWCKHPAEDFEKVN